MKRFSSIAFGTRLRAWTALVLLALLAAGPLGALVPEEQAPCCCGDVCYMDCARDAQGLDRHLEGDGERAAWHPASPCAAECSGIAVGFSVSSLEGRDAVAGGPAPKPARGPVASAAADLEPAPALGSASPRGPPLFF